MKRHLKQWSIALCLILTTLSWSQNTKEKILFVLTSHDKLGNTGKPTGSWIEEFATPYYFFTDKGYEIVIATPKGGQAPIDPKSTDPAFQTEATKRYYNDKLAQNAMKNTVKITQVKAKNFKAVFYPGGHGPMWDLASDINSIKIIQDFYEQQKPLAFVCHGTVALINVKDKKGKHLIQGKQVTGFCNSEENAVQLTQIVPFSLEDKLKSQGAKYVKANDWSSFAIEDGQLITGQNPQSSEAVAIKLLNKI